jgi:hypothetical protein
MGGLTGSARLRQALAAMYASGEDAEDMHDQAVDSLRRYPEETVVAITAEYGRCPAGDYALRRALVRAAGVIDHTSAIPFLASVALAEIPQEQSAQPHSFSTVAEETIIRMTAVDGIARRAQEGDEDAADLLMKCVESPSFSVRRAAVAGLMSTPYGDERRGEIEALVPPDQRFIFELRNVSVTEAEQVRDPTRHLRAPDGESTAPKPAVSGEGSAGGQPPTTT